MNALLPSLLIVLLAEAGGPLPAHALRRPQLLAFVMALLVFAGAALGWELSETMMPAARLLMLGVLIAVAGIGRFWNAGGTRKGWMASVLAASRSSAPSLAFGFGPFFADPVSPALGVLFALGLAAGIAYAEIDVPPVLRRTTGGLLIALGVFCALSALVRG